MTGWKGVLGAPLRKGSGSLVTGERVWGKRGEEKKNPGDFSKFPKNPRVRKLRGQKRSQFKSCWRGLAVEPPR